MDAWARDLGHAGPLVVGHRGDAVHCLENTLPSFMAATAMGAAIELDVRLTADNVVVVFHDATLARLASQTELVAALSWRELQSIQLIHPADRTRQGTIPRLDSVVAALPRHVPMFVEIKCEHGRRQAAAIVRAAMAVLSSRDVASYAVMSFNPFVVRELRKLYPNVMRGYLYETYAETELPAWQKWLLRERVLGFWMCPHFWGPHVALVTPAQVARDRIRGQATVVWTADTQAERARVHKAQAAVLITNDPASALIHP
jgi:glycerophosphoryl diester phosphodiesterase